jgi:hypothetical protein
MKHREMVFHVLVFSLLVSGCAFTSAQSLRASPPIGAVVQTWHYDPLTNIVTLKIVNTSHKDITAFNIAIKETYVDGRVEEHEMLEELVGKILAAKELQGTAQEEAFRKEYGDGAFHPGEVRDEKLPVQPGLTDYQGVIDVVTYIDGTADAPINNAALERIVEERKAAVDSKKMATEIIKTALADPNDTDPSMTAARKIQDQATVWRHSHTKMDLDPVVLESIANELKSSHAMNKRDALKQLADREDAEVSMLSVHAAVVKNGGQQ